MHVLVVDNYDSFTYNLVQYLAELGARTTVWRNDRFALDDVAGLAPDAIVISPGPCTPAEAGLSVDLVRRYGVEIPMLGVCLGHQAIGEAYGARVVRAPVVKHGKTSAIRHDGSGPFEGLPERPIVTRYHSLVVVDLPDVLVPIAWAEDAVARPAADGTSGSASHDVVMALRHAHHPVWGLQFHPESILTEHGHAMLRSFLEFARERARSSG